MKKKDESKKYYYHKKIVDMSGKEIDVMDIGPCSIPTGEFLVGDPLVYLGSKYEKRILPKNSNRWI